MRAFDECTDADLDAFSVEELAQCAEREVKQRAWVYPKRIADGKLSPEKARREALMMKRIARDYHARIPDLFGPLGSGTAAS
jgi:hypothetical protein